MVTDQKTSTSPVSETETPSSVKALKPLSSANTKSNIKPDADTVTKNTFIKGGVNMNTNTNEDVEKENMEGKPMVNNELDMDDSENEHLKCELTGVSKEWVQAEVAAEKEQVELFNHKKQERVNEVAAMTETSKNASLINLNSLVDKTLFYTKFLKKRMEERQKEQAEKEAAKAKRAEKKRAKQKEASARVESAEPCTKRVKRSKGTPVQTTLMGTKLSTAIENPTKATEGKRGGRRGRPKEVVPALTLDLDAVAQSKMSHANDGEERTAEKRFINGELVPDRQPKMLTGGVLRDYQIKGLEWMVSLWENGLNGMLGDEMGLGKTLQCIAFICYLLEMGVDGPFYVVTPLSTLQNWVNEFNRFAPTINAILYHGRPEDREEIREQNGLNGGRISNMRKDTVVVTSYEICMNDRKFFQHIRWKYIVVDEGHRLKNLNCRLIQELKSYFSVNRLLLTGTPLQNNLAELWSLLNFLLPDIFDDLESFQAWFDFDDLAEGEGAELIVAEAKEDLLGKLHVILEPFLLRRLKTDVAYSIPPKKEIVLSAAMTARQLNMYKYTLEKNVAAVLAASRPDEAKAESILSDKSDKSDKLNNVENINSLSSRKPSRKGVTKRSYKELTDTEFFKNVTGDGLGNDGYIAPVDAESLVEPVLGQDNRVTNIKMNNVVMQLRKVVNHPYLLDYPLTDQGEFRIDEDLVRSCGKLMMLDRLLPALKKRGHRVLIFSQMTSMLDILQDYCYLRDIQYSRLDGSTSQEEREAEIKAFRNDENRSVFLLSTRAGGLGINLVSADTVIIYDSDWNPQVDLQAMDRAHRIGQTKPVLVYRLVTNATIEERVFDKAQTKRRLEKLVVHKDKFKGVIANGEATKGALTMDDILRVLNEKDRVQVCDDPLGVVSDADLEKWLDRSEAAFIPPIDQSDNHKVIGIESATTKFLAE